MAFDLRIREEGGYELRASYVQSPGWGWPIINLPEFKRQMRWRKMRDNTPRFCKKRLRRYSQSTFTGLFGERTEGKIPPIDERSCIERIAPMPFLPTHGGAGVIA